MANLASSELLFIGGIVVMVLAIITIVLSLVLFHITGKRLHSQLEKEFGKKRRLHR